MSLISRGLNVRVAVTFATCPWPLFFLFSPGVPPPRPPSSFNLHVDTESWKIRVRDIVKNKENREGRERRERKEENKVPCHSRAAFYPGWKESRSLAGQVR